MLNNGGKVLLKFIKKLIIIAIILYILIGVLHIQNILIQRYYPKEYSEYVEKYSRKYNVDPLLIYAIMKTEKYLDDAYLAGLHEISIVHGIGEGILKNGIRRMLKSHKQVKSSRKGDAFEGGDGVTIVTLSS